MTKDKLRECLARVESVTQAWGDDKTLSTSLRQMSLHVNQLAADARRRKDICSSSVKNVESRFCLMCHRLKAGVDECNRTLEQCHLLKQVGHSAVHQKVSRLGLFELSHSAGRDAPMAGNSR